MRFSKNIYLKNHIAILILMSIIIKFIPFQKIREKIISNNEFLKEVYTSDFAASIAGGDSFSDIYGLKRLIYISLPQLFVLNMGKKLIVLPQTLGPFKGRLAKSFASYILKRAFLVYSRDEVGLKEVQEFLGNKFDSTKYKFCYDVGLIINPIKPATVDLKSLLEKVKKNSKIIGLNVSGLLYMGGYTRNNMFELKVDYRELITDIIEFLIQKKSFNVLLVPHVFGIVENTESDLIACMKIYNELKKKYSDEIFLVQDSYNQNEIKYIIGLCDFFIGSRMHACIAALSQNIPAISIAYSKKFLGVMKSLGVESLVADPRELEKREILNIIDQGIDNKELLRKQLKERMPEVKETVLNIFKNI